MADAVLCQSCGIEAPARYVEFHQNIGMLFMRRRKSIKANLCKKCVNKFFWPMTGTTLAVGWLGTISVIIAPLMVINNTARYLMLLGMPAVPPGATRPQVNDATIPKLFPLVAPILQRVKAGEQLDAIARELAPPLGVTPGQVIVYFRAVARANRPVAQQPPTGGFPVQLPAPPNFTN